MPLLDTTMSTGSDNPVLTEQDREHLRLLSLFHFLVAEATALFFSMARARDDAFLREQAGHWTCRRILLQRPGEPPAPSRGSAP